MDIKYSVVRSRRRTISVEVRTDGSVVVRAPYRMDAARIGQFVRSKQDWIEKHLEAMLLRQQTISNNRKHFTEEEIKQIIEKAKQVIPQRTACFAERIGVDYGRITLRNQKTRWGSCSAKGNLNFNYMLAAMPPEILDYVVVHELCHRLEMNHSPHFWSEVEKTFPDYREAKKWLKEHGTEYIL
mgnify:CR=1 FL=1